MTVDLVKRPVSAGVPAGPVYVRRVEMRLARRPVHSLAKLPREPDPLVVFARAFEQVRGPRGESADVMLDFVSLAAGQRRWMRRRMARGVSEEDAPPKAMSRIARFASELLVELGVMRSTRGGQGGPVGPQSDIEFVERRTTRLHLAEKLRDPDAMLELQILVRVTAPSDERTKSITQGFLAAFEIFASSNEFRVSGVRCFGAVLLTSDVWWRRRFFDFRFRSGYFRPRAPRGGNVVNLAEAWPFLKPPTKHCAAENVVRAGPYLSPAPRDMPLYRGKPGVLPLGLVMRAGDDKEVMVGIKTSEYFSDGSFGRSRYGKTEDALNHLLHVALIERHGGLLYDPAATALQRILPYLTEAGVRERVVLMNLAEASLDARHVGWNPLSTRGLAEHDLDLRVESVVNSIAAAVGWSDGSTGRTLALLQASVATLMQLSMRLPVDLQPTLFTIRRLLRDPVWRAAAIARLSPSEREFWEDTYAGYGDDVRRPLNQVLSRLHNNRTVRATLGSPRSTYDPRQAMDACKIVLAAPPNPDANLIASIFLQAHIDAARTRSDMTDAEIRHRLAYWIYDEAQTYDRPTGTRGSAMAVTVEQLAKFGIRTKIMAQSPLRLGDATIEALTTNASVLRTTATAAQSGRFFDQQWGGAIDASGAVMALQRYHYIVGPTHLGRKVDPFYLRGLPLEEMWPSRRHPESLPALHATIDATCRPTTVRETCAAIEDHDDRILHALINTNAPQRTTPDAARGDVIPDGLTLGGPR